MYELFENLIGKRGRSDNELSMPVSVVVNDSTEGERVFVLDPGNSRIKCLTYDGKFMGHLGMNKQHIFVLSVYIRLFSCGSMILKY